MAGFNNGPLTGAPIDKPQVAQQGDCCPPAAMQSKAYAAPTGLASVVLGIDATSILEGGKEIASVELRETAQTTAGQLPTLNGYSVIDAPPGFLDILSLDLDTSGASTNQGFAALITNECGCCELVALTTFVPV